MGVIDEVKQRTDIIDVIGQYATLTKSGRTFRALCPFHSEKHPSFYVYPDQQSWHCFGACNTGGDVFSFIMKKQNIDFGEALRLLAQRAGVTIPSRFEGGTESEAKQRLYQANQAAAQYFQNMLNATAGKKALSYAAGRGFTPQTIADFQLGYSPNSWEGLKQHLAEKGYTEKELLDAGLIIEAEGGKTHDRFRNKLMFPISDARGRIIGFGSRVLDESLPKYVNSPQTPIFDKSGILYGLNLAKDAIRQQDTAVIVEGYMDVITAHQNGFNNVVASMGTSVTERQINTLKKMSKEMIFALDADAAGEMALLRVEETSAEVINKDAGAVHRRNANIPLDELPPLNEAQVRQDQKHPRIVTYAGIPDIDIKVLILPQGKDPDDVIKEDAPAWQKLLEGAVPIIDFTFDKVTSELDLTKVSNKTLARDKLLPIIGEIKDIVRQAHYLQKLARLIEVNERNLEADLARIKPRQVKSRTERPAPGAAPSLQPILSSPKEEYCLALLLQHPELKKRAEQPAPEYFQNSENREIFIAWQQSDKIESIKEKLEPAIHEHLDYLLTRNLLSNNLEQKYTECVLDLRVEFLRSRIKKREAVLAHEAESGGKAAELAKLKELNIEDDIQLKEVFAQKSRRRLEQRK